MNTTSTIRNILVPHDFSDTAEAALTHAIGLAGSLGSRITILHVFEVPGHGAPEVINLRVDLAGELAAASHNTLEKILARVRRPGLQIEGKVRRGHAWREIDAEAAEAKADLIVMGTQGGNGFTRALLGSVTDKVLRTAPCPVLTVHAPPSAP